MTITATNYKTPDFGETVTFDTKDIVSMYSCVGVPGYRTKAGYNVLLKKGNLDFDTICIDEDAFQLIRAETTGGVQG